MSIFVSSFDFEFVGLRLTAYVIPEREAYINFEQLCSLLGLDLETQFELIIDDDAISDMLEAFKSEESPDLSASQDSIWFLNVKALPFWLLTLESVWIRDELRESLIQFKRDALSKVGTLMRFDMFRHNTDTGIFSNN